MGAAILLLCLRDQRVTAYRPTSTASAHAAVPSGGIWREDVAGTLTKGAELALAAAALLIGVYIFATTIIMVANCWTVVPNLDQWDNLILAPDKTFSGIVPVGLLNWFFAQHNEHRIAVPRLIFAIDRFFFASTSRFNFTCNMVIQVGVALLVIYLGTRLTARRFSDLIWIIGTVLALVFSAMQWENFLWGFQVQFLGVGLAAVATFATLVLGRPSAGRLLAVIALEAIAVYTLSSGMAVPFLAVPLAIWVGWSRRDVAILSVAALTLLACYLYGYETPRHNSDPLRSITHIASIISYLLNEIGDPFGLTFSEAHIRDAGTWNRFCGGVGIVLLGTATADMIRRRERRGPVPAFIAVAVFVVGMELLTALGRLGLGEALSSRYSTPVLLFWTSLFMIGLIRLGKHNGRLRILAMAAVLPLLFGLAYYQPSFVAMGRAWTLPRLEATTALLAGVNDPAALIHSYPQPSIPNERAPWLRERHLSIFSEEWSDWLGTPLADHVRLADKSKCRGTIDTAAPVGAVDPKGWRASGWVWDNEDHVVPRRIVFADSTGQVAGYALTRFPKPKPASIDAFALLDNRREACPIGHWPAPA